MCLGVSKVVSLSPSARKVRRRGTPSGEPGNGVSPPSHDALFASKRRLSGASTQRSSFGCGIYGLIALWVGLCALLIRAHHPQQPLLSVVFYSFVASFAAAACLRPIVRLAPGSSCLSIAALQAHGVQLLLSLLVLRLYLIGEVTGDLGFSEFAGALYTGFALHRVWYIAANGLFISLPNAVDIVYQATIASWYLYSFCKACPGPTVSFARNVAIYAGTSSFAHIMLQEGALAALVDIFSFLAVRAPAHVRLVKDVLPLRKCDLVGSSFVAIISLFGVILLFLLISEYMDRRKQGSENVRAALSAAAAADVAMGAESVPRTSVPSHLWLVHGALYNLEPFMQRHPGGDKAILLGQGRDCTAMFESYHPFTNKHREVLSKYRMDNKVPLTVPTRAKADAFYDTLCCRADEIFRCRGIDVSERGSLVASYHRLGYYVLVLGGLALSWSMYARGDSCGPVLFALFSWLMGAMGHDGGHFAASSTPWVNMVLGYVGMGLIAQPSLWLHQHTYAHHSYTNEPDRDPDLHHFPSLRTHPSQRWESRFLAQARRAYVLFWWTMTTIGEAFYLPLYCLFNGELNEALKLPPGHRWGLAQSAHLLLYFGLVIFTPLWSGGGWWALVSFWAINGILFGVFTQVNHLNGDSFVEQSESNGTGLSWGSSWAMQQVETSNNFGTGNLIWFYLSNGLNYQIEHHLWPGINHEHLWILAPMVEETCKEFGVRYRNYQSLWEVLGATLSHFKSLAFKPPSIPSMTREEVVE